MPSVPQTHVWAREISGEEEIDFNMGENEMSQSSKRQTRGRQGKQRSRIGAWVVGLLVIGVLVVGGGLALTGAFRTAPQETDTTFSVPTFVGKAAPEFTATGADGKPYTVKPGDGRSKAIVFYMGYR